MIGFITVRSASSRLKEKIFLNFGKFNVLGHVIERLRTYSIDPLVCTTNSKDDIKIIEIADKHNCKYFRGSERNKIKRWLDCANTFNIETFHTVDCDDPFFCGEMMHESMGVLLKSNLDYVSPNERSNEGSGEVGYSINRKFLRKLNCVEDDNKDTEMVDMYFKQKLADYKEYISTNKFKSKYRLTLDYKEDYWLLRTIVEILGQNPSREEIDELFYKNPDLHKINYFRNLAWKQKQIKQNSNQI